MDDPVRHVVAADRVPQPLSGSRTADSFFSFFMPSGSKSASLRMVTQRRTFCMHSFVYSSVCLPVIYISLHITPLYSPLPAYRFLTASSYFSTYFLPQHRCFHRFFLRSPPIPPALPPPYSQRPRSSFASYVPSLAPLYLQLPSPRPLSGRYAASESLPFERSFRLLYCFANGLPLPVDSYCIQCLMHENSHVSDEMMRFTNCISCGKV